MTRTEVFFDTNVLLYLNSDDDAKIARTRELLSAGGFVSVQILNEYASVARGKFRLPWTLVKTGLDGIKAACEVVPLSLATHERGLRCAERYKLAIFDANIVAAAVLAGCTTLYSEDMHNGLVIDGLTIRNPYKKG
jgi:predicted nucleic acid-binding protein